jgi:hypothetical protein
MPLEQTAKLQQRRCVSDAFTSKFHTAKASDRMAAVPSIFNRHIGNPNELLSGVSGSNFSRPIDGRLCPTIVIKQLKLTPKERQQRYRLNLSQKATTSRQALFAIILKLSEGYLHKSYPSNWRCSHYTAASFRLEGVEPDSSLLT